MQYNPPFDQNGIPEASYVDGNPSTGVAGSIPPAAQMEYPQREIVALIAESGQTPSNSDLTQMLRAVRGGSLTTYADQSIAANVIIIRPGTAHSNLHKGLPFRIFPAFTSTSATVTVQVNDMTPVLLKRRDGTPLVPGDVVAGAPIDIVSDGTNFCVLGLAPSDVMLARRYHAVGDADAVISALDGVVTTSVALTAPRTWTLPAATSVFPGTVIVLSDFFGAASSDNTVTVACSASDTINGQPSEVLTAPYFQLLAYSDGASRWSFQFVDLSQLPPVILAQGGLIAGLLASVSALAMALALFKTQTAAQIAALWAALAALESRQVTATTTGSQLTVTDTYTDTTGLTLQSGSPTFGFGTGLSFPKAVTGPAYTYFPLSAYASNVKVLGGRYMTLPYTETGVHGPSSADGGNFLTPYANDQAIYMNVQGTVTVTPMEEGFSVARTRYGAAFAAQPSPALLSADPQALFGINPGDLVYNPAWNPWTSYNPELSHLNGYWHDLTSRGLWAPRVAGNPVTNFNSVSQVFQASYDEQITSYGVSTRVNGISAARLLICGDAGGVPDLNNVALDVSATVLGLDLVNHPNELRFTLPYPFLKRANKRYHFVVLTDSNVSSSVWTFVKTQAASPDPSQGPLLYRTATGWQQDPKGAQLRCRYSRATFAAGTPIELPDLSLGSGIDTLDMLAPAVVPQGCDIVYGTILPGSATYQRFGAIDPNNPASNLLASRPFFLPLFVELLTTGKTAPVIDTQASNSGSGAVNVQVAELSGTLRAESAVRTPSGPVTKITRQVTLLGYVAGIHTYTETLETGTGYATQTPPTAVGAPIVQTDGTTLLTFSWTLGAAVTTFTVLYQGTTSDITKLFTVAKSITTAAT